MCDINQKKKQFKNVLKYGYHDLSEENKMLLSCVKKAYRDMTTARSTFANISEKFTNDDLRKSFYEKIRDALAKFLKIDFSNQEDFDYQYQTNLYSEISDLYSEDLQHEFKGVKDGKIPFGCVQKLVNMTFKYFLLAAEDFENETKDLGNQPLYKKIIDIKDYLHCPIDSIIIKHINENIEKTSLEKNITVPWSKMQYEYYFNIQKAIREILDKNYSSNNSKLDYDFFVWSNENNE